MGGDTARAKNTANFTRLKKQRNFQSLHYILEDGVMF